MILDDCVKDTRIYEINYDDLNCPPDFIQNSFFTDQGYYDLRKFGELVTIEAENIYKRSALQGYCGAKQLFRSQCNFSRARGDARILSMYQGFVN